MIEILNQLFQRDLDKLINEINAYPHEEAIWLTDIEIKNAAGSLALHLVGNLNHYIGATLGNTDYIRDRKFEFSGTFVSRNELISKVNDTKTMLNEVLNKLDKTALDQEYKFDFFGKQSTSFYLFHFLTHLNYHLGQINYHRRILSLK